MFLDFFIPSPVSTLGRKQNAAGKLGVFPCLNSVGKGLAMLGTLLVVVLVLALVGVVPRWSHSREWGYFPTGGVGLALLIVVILVLLGRI